ncbi:Sugar (and other) transporter [Geosmithia morbida]|uniref:Sugar (And other) transporter n=1 Tax=Geosmithia morbida TaxID=1094350 RepID=A0A9P4YRY6_9HYPO|nr:Sugar (and other) transporter [Geosmithia morbida]KAF4122018.1 Sugar (and other) transporter [Geosmithia morbida]
MAGGVKKPVNIFRLKNVDEPPGTFNWRLWFAVFSFGLLGAARGVDEGLISGAFNTPSFQREIKYSSYSEAEKADIKANVSAMVQVGSVGGALMAFAVCDRIGRVWATRVLSILWALGTAIFMACGVNGNLGGIYAGRFIAGLGVGMTAVVGPIYIAEISPSAIRGLCTCVFTGAVYLGVVLAYFANYGASVHIDGESNDRWLVPTSLHIIFAGLVLVLTFFQSESPRFLVKQGKVEQATRVLAWIRQQDTESEYVRRNIAEIQAGLDHELEASRGVGWVGKVKEMFLNRNNLYRLYMTTSVQFLSQWSGAGSITLYAPDLFALIGIGGEEEGLLVTAVFGICKFVAAICCALFLVDVIGRKRALLSGITLQTIAMVYVASFLTAVPELGVVDGYEMPDDERGPSKGAIFMIYLSGYANSRATPNMLLPVSSGGISPKGTFWCYAAVTLVGGLWVWFFVPETSGRSLESMDALFDLPWYRIGLFGTKYAEARDLVIDEKQEAAEEQQGQETRVENKV